MESQLTHQIQPLLGSALKLSNTKVTAQLNVTNLFNKTYISGALNSSPIGPDFEVVPGLQGGGRVSYGAPLSVLGSLRAEF